VGKEGEGNWRGRKGSGNRFRRDGEKNGKGDREKRTDGGKGEQAKMAQKRGKSKRKKGSTSLTPSRQGKVGQGRKGKNGEGN